MNFITNSHFSYTVNKILILNRNSSASTFTFTAFNVAIRSIFFPTLHIQIVRDLNKLWRQRKQKYVNWRIFLSRVPQVVLIQNVCNLQMYCCQQSTVCLYSSSKCDNERNSNKTKQKPLPSIALRLLLLYLFMIWASLMTMYNKHNTKLLCSS